MQEYKYYIPVSGSDKCTDLEVRVFYDKGGYSYWSNCEIQRGFYASVCPVRKEERGSGIKMISFEAFTGMKMLINTAHRYSDKAFERAKKDAEDYIRDLIWRVCFKQGLTPITE